MATAAETPDTPAEVRQASPALTSKATPAVATGLSLLIVAAAIGSATKSMPEFWHAYLLGVTYAASLALGGLFFVIAHHLVGGRWGSTVRRIAEAIAYSIGAVAILFVPLLVTIGNGDSQLYVWNNLEEVAANPILEGKACFLNAKWFVIRTLVYFALWFVVARYFFKTSVRQDETGDVASLRKLQKWSGPAMLIFALTMNFAAFDWLMSLDPIWFSTMFGVYYFSGAVVGGLSLMILVACVLQNQGFLTRSITTEHYHDLSKLLSGFVIFWGYIAFSQFMLIWYANVPEETGWYASRQTAPTVMGISTATGLLFVFHLFVPMLGFMSSKIRRNKTLMAAWAFYLLVVHAFDLHYVIMPTTALVVGDASTGSSVWLLEFLCVVGATLVLAGTLLRCFTGKWLMPVRDPRTVESLTYVTH